MPPHSTVLDALGAVTLIGYAGFLGGYVGSVLYTALLQRENDPLFVAEHMSAVAGVIAGLTMLATYL
jgi:hypothetical protein